MNAATQRLHGVLDWEWRTARELADMAGVNRRAAGQRLGRLVREGLAEARSGGERPSLRSDGPPFQYRRIGQ